MGQKIMIEKLVRDRDGWNVLGASQSNENFRNSMIVNESLVMTDDAKHDGVNCGVVLVSGYLNNGHSRLFDSVAIAWDVALDP